LINGRLIRVHYCRLGIKRPTTYHIERERERDTHSKDRYTKKGRREIDRNEMKYVQPMSKNRGRMRKMERKGERESWKEQERRNDKRK
jgi:hypothetical protein